MSKHRKVIEFGSKANADNYIAAGWKLIETRSEPFALGRTIIVDRVGWPDGAGQPVLPQPTTIYATWKKGFQQIDLECQMST